MCEIQDALAAAMGLGDPLPIARAKRETNGDYHGDLTHVGSTMLREYRKSPARYNALYVARTIERDAPSNAMVLGSLTHALIDQPDAWQTEFLLADGCNSRRGKAWDAYAEEAARRGRTPILEEQLSTARAMAAALLAHPTAGQFFRAPGAVEQVIRWRHECGLKLKCKLDKLLVDEFGNTVVDIKTSADPTPEAFKWSVKEYGYDIQEVMYLDGVHSLGRHKPTDFIFCVVGNVAPYDVWCYTLGPRSLKAARDATDDLYCRLQRSLTTGDWLAPKQLDLNVLEIPGNGAAEEVNLIIDGEEVSL